MSMRTYIGQFNIEILGFRMVQYLNMAGKSSTSSMLAYVLSAMGDDLTAVVGAEVPQVFLKAQAVFMDPVLHQTFLDIVFL